MPNNLNLLTGDELRAAVRDANNMSGPSDPTQPAEYAAAGARAYAAKLRAQPAATPAPEKAVPRDEEILATLRPLYADEQSAAMGAADDLRTARTLLARHGGQPAAPGLPERDPTRPADSQGLFRKFDVRRTDGSDQPGGKHHGCRYFVLDVDHDAYAAAALTAYAASCEATHPDLARDLREKWGAQPAASAEPFGWFQNSARKGEPPHYEQVSDEYRGELDVFPLYAAPVAAQQPAAIREALKGMQRWFGKWPEFVPAYEKLNDAAQAVAAMNTALKVDHAYAPVAAQARPTDDQLWDQTLAERDEYHDMADQLAAQIAAITGQDIGEHSSANCPWRNAMLAADEFIAAQLRKLCDGHAAQACPSTPRYDEWRHLRETGTWTDGVPDWARDHSGCMNDFVAARSVIEELATALAAQAQPVSGCDECHITHALGECERAAQASGQAQDAHAVIGRAFLNVLRDSDVRWRQTDAWGFISRVAEGAGDLIDDPAAIDAARRAAGGEHGN